MHLTFNLKSYKARIRVSTGSRHVSASIYHALVPDIGVMPSGHEIADLSLKDAEFVFKIETSDIATLRASINSYLRLVDTSHKCLTV